MRARHSIDWTVVGLIVAVVGVWCVSAWADTPTALNEPSETWRRLTEVVDTLKPQGGAMYDVLHDDVRGVGTVALYEVRRDEQAVASLRAGYAGDHALLGGLEVHLGHLVPASWPVVPVLAKYVKVAWLGGRDFNEHEWITGPSVAVEARW